MSGNRAEVVEDSTSIGSSSTETTSEFNVENDERVTLQVDGDGNSSDLTIKAEAKVRNVSGDSWTEWDTTVNNEDLTTTDNNSKAFTYDVENLAKIRWKQTNNSANSTTVTSIAARAV